MTLEDYLRSQQAEFRWGVSDCMQLVAGWVEARSGASPAAQFEYASEAEADAIVDEYGDLVGLITAFLGEPSADMRACPRGAVVVASFPATGALAGIAVPPNAAFRSRDGAIVPVALGRCLCWWEVPCRPS